MLGGAFPGRGQRGQILVEAGQEAAEGAVEEGGQHGQADQRHDGADIQRARRFLGQRALHGNGVAHAGVQAQRVAHQLLDLGFLVLGHRFAHDDPDIDAVHAQAHLPPGGLGGLGRAGVLGHGRGRGHAG